MMLCVWHVRRVWVKNVNRLASSPNNENEMFNDLGFIMKNCPNEEVDNANSVFFNKFANTENVLDYFHNNWVFDDNICMFT
jgi:hypothetical protein